MISMEESVHIVAWHPQGVSIKAISRQLGTGCHHRFSARGSDSGRRIERAQCGWQAAITESLSDHDLDALLMPGHATVSGRQNYSVSSYRPAVAGIRKVDCEQIVGHSGPLPLP